MHNSHNEHQTCWAPNSRFLPAGKHKKLSANCAKFLNKKVSDGNYASVRETVFLGHLKGSLEVGLLVNEIIWIVFVSGWQSRRTGEVPILHLLACLPLSNDKAAWNVFFGGCFREGRVKGTCSSSVPDLICWGTPLRKTLLCCRPSSLQPTEDTASWTGRSPFTRRGSGCRTLGSLCCTAPGQAGEKSLCRGAKCELR